MTHDSGRHEPPGEPAGPGPGGGSGPGPAPGAAPTGPAAEPNPQAGPTSPTAGPAGPTGPAGPAGPTGPYAPGALPHVPGALPHVPGAVPYGPPAGAGAPWAGPPPGGWGWGAPRPPKPGVIPLAPLGAGDVLGGAFAALGRAWKQLLGVSLLVFGFLGLLGGVVLFTGYQGFEEAVLELEARSTPPGTDTVRSFLLGLGALWSGMSLLLLLGTSLVQAAAAAVLRGAVLGRTVPFGTVWRQAWSRVWAVAGGNLLVALATVVPVFGLLVLGWLALLGIAFSSSPDAPELPLLPPGWLAPVGLLGGLGLGLAGIWLWVRFSLAPAAVVFEGLGPVAALRRSARLVRGAWWRVFGIALLAGVIAAFATWLLQMPFQFLGAVPAAFPSDGPDGTDLAPVLTAVAVALAFSLVGTVVAQAVTAPFSPLVHALLYVDRRIRTEDLARSLAEAAARDPWPPYHGAPARRA